PVRSRRRAAPPTGWRRPAAGSEYSASSSWCATPQPRLPIGANERPASARRNRSISQLLVTQPRLQTQNIAGACPHPAPGVSVRRKGNGALRNHTARALAGEAAKARIADPFDGRKLRFGNGISAPFGVDFGGLSLAEAFSLQSSFDGNAIHFATVEQLL